MRRLLTLILAMGLVLTACTSSGTDGSSTTAEAASEPTTSVPAETTTTAAETTTTAAQPTTTEAAETTTTAASTAGGGGDDCLVGTWVLDTNTFVENFRSVFAEQGMPDAEVSALDGTFTVEMNSDGTYDAVRDGWGFAVATSEGTVSIEINGTESGNWSTSGDVLTIDGDITDLTVDSTVEVDGQVIPIPNSQVPVDTPPGIATDSTFTCSGDTLTLTNEGIESVMNRA